MQTLANLYNRSLLRTLAVNVKFNFVFVFSKLEVGRNCRQMTRRKKKVIGGQEHLSFIPLKKVFCYLVSLKKILILLDFFLSYI